MVQGGDFTLRNGKGGESIYGGTFNDENLTREIDAEGLLVMANRGKNTNGSQFFVSLRPCPHLAGKHVVMGRVVKGYDVIEGLSKLPVDEKDRPTQLVTISHCGELERKGEHLRRTKFVLPQNDNHACFLPVVPKKPRSPSPAASLSRSASVASDRSRSRSRSPPARSRARSDSPAESRSRSRSPDRRRSKHRSSRHRSRDGSDAAEDEDRKRRRKHRKHRSSRHKRSPSGSPELTAEQIAVLEQRKMEEEAEAAQKAVEEERRARDRQRELEEIKRRNERRQGDASGVRFKGRGQMKAPGGGGGGGGGMRGW